MVPHLSVAIELPLAALTPRADSLAAAERPVARPAVRFAEALVASDMGAELADDDLEHVVGGLARVRLDDAFAP